MSETIHVAYILDDNYASYTAVSMASLLFNTKSIVHFHVVSNRLSDENKSKLMKLGEAFPHGSWSFYSFTFDTCFMKTVNYVTIETYYRIYLPLILPDIERIIYLDGDTIVNGDIGELWKIDLGKKALGLVPHCCTHDSSEMRAMLIKLDKGKEYCNAGVMLIALKEFAKYKLHLHLERLIEDTYNRFVQAKVASSFLADQDIINYFFWDANAVLLLPYKYNAVLSVFFSPTHDEAGFGLPALACAYETPVIFHYAGQKNNVPLKKSLNKLKLSFLLQYYRYKKMTSFYEPCEDAMMQRYVELHEWTFSQAIIDFGTIISCFPTEVFDKAALALKELVGHKKIALYGAGCWLSIIMVMLAARGIYPDIIVDRDIKKHGDIVYGYDVKTEKEVLLSPNKFFVVITTKSYLTADQIKDSLASHGYSNENVYYVFQPVVDRINEDIRIKMK